MVDDTQETERLLSAQAVADRLSLSKRAVFRMKSEGLICASLTVGRGAIRWRESDIDLWIPMDCPSDEQFEARREAEKCQRQAS